MEGAECATTTIRNLAEYYEFQRGRKADRSNAAAPVFAKKLAAGILPADAAFRLFEEAGIPVASTAVIRNADEAAAAAERMGFPVALKIESAQITHKSDVGGVALKLNDQSEVREAYGRIINEVSRRVPTAKIDGVVVQRMAGAGVEMILGVKRDPLFGPVVLCGFGGILVEVLKDIAVAIPPISRAQAREMLKRLRGFSILTGVRGKPPADVEALCDAIVGVARLATALGDQLLGLDINPLIVLPKGQGAIAVDAVVELQ
jgi:acyl-CoA synthetase (NDP forming)